MSKAEVGALLETYEMMSTREVLSSVLNKYGESMVLASSLGAEDQVLTHMLASISSDPQIFILDTGRLNQESYDVMDATIKRYKFNYRVYYPNTHDVETMVGTYGPNLFYTSVENRKQCCYVRKVAPLQRALQGKSAWITGIRRAQSVTRANMKVLEWDDTHQLVKVNPLIGWSKEQVWEYIQVHEVPYNVLHDKGYVSIGCEPCTRAILEGEEERSGRWWWEPPEHKECGLHVQAVKDKDEQ